VAVRERTASSVLSGEANVRARLHQGANGQRLAKGPVHFARLKQRHPLSELALQFGMNGEALGRTDGDLRDLFQRRHVDACFGSGEIGPDLGRVNATQLGLGNRTNFVEDTL
jgi:hypothetical protein